MTAERVRQGAPDPDDARRQLQRIEDAAQAAGIALATSEEALPVLCLCCQRAPYLARLLARDPARLGRVASDPYLRRQKSREVLAAELAERIAAVSDPGDLAAVLRSFRGDELVRCGARELALGKPIEVGAELAHLADVCFDAAIDFHRAALVERHGEPLYVDDHGAVRACQLSVIAMGKLGGEELNFASDVDVIYVYSSDNEPETGGAAITLHQFFGELCRRVTAALAEVTADDVVFRVDLRLRPEGSRGPIANSLPSLERYYETWGRPWERQAWLKARPCAGCPELGAEVMAVMRPFVYRRAMSVEVIDEVNALNQRIKAELVPSEVESGFDVKNGDGGIREIEFFVQAIQLILAGRLPSLRTQSTVAALDALLFAGIVTETERQALGTAYRFLRHVEHLLQLESGRQTQRLPADPAARDLLGRRLGFDGRESFEAALVAHTSEVARLFGTLGDSEPGPPPEIYAILNGRLAGGGDEQAFARLGFRQPERAAALVERARRLAGSVFGHAPQGAAARVAAPLLSEIARSPDPDQALGYAVELAARRRSYASVWRLMDQKPEVLRLVASLFGTSQYLSKQLLADPELLDLLLMAGKLAPRRAAADIESELETTLALDPADEESSWNALAAIKNEQVFRVGLADVGGALAPLEVCAELSAIAEAVARHAGETVERSMRASYGWPRDESGQTIPFAVFALGKLGGRELGYASDLDIVFVYGPEGESAGESDGERKLPAVSFFSRFAQRLMGGLRALHASGRLYQIDTRLRPSGSQGMLVSSLAAWRNYHRDRARLWERQALTKLRALAGHRELGALVESENLELLYGGGRPSMSPAEIAAAVRSMRERIERELSQRKSADLKVGRGGLVDIEFAAQYLQLAFGDAHPELRGTSTTGALEAALEAGLADGDSLALLIDGYTFLRFLEHRVRIVNDQPVHALPTDGPELEKLARRAGYARVEQLHESYEHWTASIRRAFEVVVPGPRTSPQRS
jgi:glutamate-ammonia-ligase adenylyltransferase